jgi:hypothetical protein
MDTKSLPWAKILARAGALSYAIWGVFRVYVSWQLFFIGLTAERRYPRPNVSTGSLYADHSLVCRGDRSLVQLAQ